MYLSLVKSEIITNKNIIDLFIKETLSKWNMSNPIKNKFACGKIDVININESLSNIEIIFPNTQKINQIFILFFKLFRKKNIKPKIHHFHYIEGRFVEL